MRFHNVRRSWRLFALLLVLALVPACGGDGTGSGRNPLPALTSVSPTAVEAEVAAEITLTVTGSGFVRQSVVRVNGADRVTEFVSASLLRGRLTAADIAAAGTLQVTVFSPAPGGGASGAAQFTVNNPGPLVQGVTPFSLPALSAGGTVTLTGLGFVPQSQVLTGATALQTTYVSATELRALVTEAQLQTAGALPLRVQNPAPGGGLSNEVTIGVLAPNPVITSFSPGFVVAGSADATVAVIGTGFVTQSQVLVNSMPRQTTRISSTELRFTLAAAELQTPGTLQIQVIGAGGFSAPAGFEVRAPVPAITSLAPAQTEAGQSSFLLRVNGTGFAPSSAVRFDGVPRPTRRVSATQLEATLTDEDLRSAGSFPITVATPTPGGGVSNALPLTLVNGVPSIDRLPSRGASVGQGFTLTVHGDGFTGSTVVRWNGAARPTTWVSATRVQAAIGAADVAAPGTAQVTVHNPAPGGGTSAAATMQVRAVPPSTLTSALQVPIPARAVVWSAATGRLYASVPASVPTHGNSVVAIDPATGAVTGSVFVGSEPRVMAVSDDGLTLYVALEGSRTIRRVALATLTPGLEFPVQAGTEEIDEIQVMPGRPGTVAVASSGSVCLYDDGVRRPQCVESVSTIAFDDGMVLYGHDDESSAHGFRTLGVTAGGLEVLRLTESAFFANYDRIHFAAGRVYSEFGPVVDAERHVQVGVVGSPGEGMAVLPDAALGRVFRLERFSQAVEVYDMNRFTPLGSIPVSLLSTNEHPGEGLLRLVRWGTDGLALRDGEQIHILRAPLAGP